jgi:hypothetical protein
MTLITLPFRPAPGDPEDISQLLADFDSILNVVNGDIRNDNISPSAAIAASKLAGIPGSQIIFSRGVTPPASPQDGDLWQFAADAPNGVYWMLRYNAGSGSAFKWEYLGGAPLGGDQVGADSVVNSASYLNAEPSLTLPRAGDYDVLFGVNSYASGTVNWQGFTTVKIGAAAASDAQAIITGFTNPAGWGTQAYGSRSLRLLGRAANDVLVLAHKSAGGQGVGFTARYMRITPIRIS